jgi:F-type H+-transporting ATPase subunit delta
MYIGVIAKRYAKALLDFALENGAETQIYERVQRFIRVYFATEELRRVLANPLLSREDKLRVLVEAVETPKERENFHIFVLAGQSNMSGRAEASMMRPIGFQ